MKDSIYLLDTFEKEGDPAPSAFSPPLIKRTTRAASSPAPSVPKKSRADPDASRLLALSEAAPPSGASAEDFGPRAGPEIRSPAASDAPSPFGACLPARSLPLAEAKPTAAMA